MSTQYNTLQENLKFYPCILKLVTSLHQTRELTQTLSCICDWQLYFVNTRQHISDHDIKTTK